MLERTASQALRRTQRWDRAAARRSSSTAFSASRSAMRASICGLMDAVLDRPKDGRDPAPDHLPIDPRPGVGSSPRPGDSPPLLTLGRTLGHLGRQQAFPEPVQDAALQLLALDLQVVAGGALAAVSCAAVRRRDPGKRNLTVRAEGAAKAVLILGDLDELDESARRSGAITPSRSRTGRPRPSARWTGACGRSRRRSW